MFGEDLPPPMFDALLMLLEPDGRKFKTSAELLQERKSCFRLSTGSENWNKILKGGFESRSVSEVYGEYRCGKTQLCHTLCVTAQLPKAQGGGEGKVIVIGKCCGSCIGWSITNRLADTEGTFRPERIQQIAERFGRKFRVRRIDGSG